MPRNKQMKYVTFECTSEFKASLETLARQERRSVSKEILVLLMEGVERKSTGSVNRGRATGAHLEVLPKPVESQLPKPAESPNRIHERRNRRLGR